MQTFILLRKEITRTIIYNKTIRWFVYNYSINNYLFIVLIIYLSSTIWLSFFNLKSSNHEYMYVYIYLKKIERKYLQAKKIIHYYC